MNAGQIEHFNELTKIQKLSEQRVLYYRSGRMKIRDVETGKDCTNEAIGRELRMIAGIETTIKQFYSDLV